MTEFKPATLVGPDGARVPAKTKAEADRLFASGYKLETAPPATVRTPDGGFQTGSISPLASYKNHNEFMTLLEQAIHRKQGMSRDLQDAKTHWRTVQRDPGMWMGKDKDFSLMSPAEQTSVRASRQSAAGAHLQGLREEEDYRKTRTENILGAATDAYTAQREDEQQTYDRSRDAKLDEGRRLDNLLKQKELGYNPGISDVTGAFVEHGVRVDNRVGGSLSWRHNNPGNIKMGAFAEKYGAVQGQKATDGGYFAVFPTLESGKQAMTELLRGSGYSNLTLDAAMKRYSNNGYGAEVLGYKMPPDMKMRDLMNDDRLASDLINNMVKREGFEVGEIKGTEQTAIKHTTWTKAKTQTLARSLKVDSEDLWNNKTDAELDEMQQAFDSNIVQRTLKAIPPVSLMRTNVSEDTAREIIEAFYVLRESRETIKRAMELMGEDPVGVDKLLDLVEGLDKTEKLGIGG